jgi:hypothetical protein
MEIIVDTFTIDSTMVVFAQWPPSPWARWSAPIECVLNE